MTRSELAKIIEHTALKPETARNQIMQLCGEAREYGFGAVCIAPAWLTTAVEALAGSSVKAVIVIGFPHGNTLSSVKAYETSQVLERGADEIDMVINIGALISGEEDVVFQDIQSVVESARAYKPRTIVKVILETALLTNSQKVLGSQLAARAGANFVKTSTGFATRGATVEDIILLRRTVGNRLGIKASGGIRNLATAQAMIAAGATRIGCSSSVSIMQEFLE